MTLLLILFIIVWMYQGLQVANLVLLDQYLASEDAPASAYFRYILVAFVIAIAWPGALMLHMVIMESSVLDEWME